MYPGHHAVKVNAALADDVEVVEEEVHEPGLAAADAAPDIETFQRRRFAARRKPAAQEPGAAFRGGFQADRELRKLLDELLLSGIANVPRARERGFVRAQ